MLSSVTQNVYWELMILYQKEIGRIFSNPKHFDLEQCNNVIKPYWSMGNKTDMYPSIPNIMQKKLKHRSYFCNTLILGKSQRYLSAPFVLLDRYENYGWKDWVNLPNVFIFHYRKHNIMIKMSKLVHYQEAKPGAFGKGNPWRNAYHWVRMSKMAETGR